MERRGYLMNTLIRAGLMYAAEVWGWRKWEEVERVQNRFMKMSIFSRWKRVGRISKYRRGLRLVSMYVLKVIEVEEGRWPKICLKEELRGLRNRVPSEWMKTVKRLFEEVGDGETLELMERDGNSAQIEEKLKRAVTTCLDQNIKEK